MTDSMFLLAWAGQLIVIYFIGYNRGRLFEKNGLIEQLKRLKALEKAADGRKEATDGKAN